MSTIDSACLVHAQVLLSGQSGKGIQKWQLEKVEGIPKSEGIIIYQK